MTDPSVATFLEVAMDPATESRIRGHGRASYPEEACGLLIGPTEGAAPPGGGDGVRRVSRSLPAQNRRTESRTHRFLIPAEDLRRTERELDGTPETIVGFYHSHPDHPAMPSEFDRDHAWPWFAYLVLAVERGEARELHAFELDPEERVFQPRALRVGPVTWVTEPPVADGPPVPAGTERRP